MLNAEPDLEVVAVAGPADDLLEFVDQTRPDVLLLNPRLPTMSAPDVCRHLVERHPWLRILIVSTNAEMDLIRACIAAGAHGYVIKDIERPELMRGGSRSAPRRFRCVL